MKQDEYTTMKTTEKVKTLLRHLKKQTGEAMYKIQERLLLREYEEQGLAVPDEKEAGTEAD